MHGEEPTDQPHGAAQRIVEMAKLGEIRGIAHGVGDEREQQAERQKQDENGDDVDHHIINRRVKVFAQRGEPLAFKGPVFHVVDDGRVIRRGHFGVRHNARELAFRDAGHGDTDKLIIPDTLGSFNIELEGGEEIRSHQRPGKQRIGEKGDDPGDKKSPQIQK